MALADIAQRVEQVLRHDGRVTVAYLFGSQVTGKIGPQSDVDVAVLLSADAPRKLTNGDLMDALVRALKTNDVDLVLLDETPIPLRYRIVRDGSLLYTTDEKVRQCFETQTVMQYLDFKPLREKAFGVAHDAIVGAG